MDAQIQINVMPSPEIISIHPWLVSAKELDSIQVTITGKYFGSYAAWDDKLQKYDNLSVLIGDSACKSTLFVSDEELICSGLPEFSGVTNVSLQVRCTALIAFSM